MATDLVRSISAYTGEEELAFGHCIPCGNKRVGRALGEKIAATRGFDSHKLASVIRLKQNS
jgi:hypothetical protein